MSYKTPILKCKMAIYTAVLHKSELRLFFRVELDGSTYWEVTICRRVGEVTWSEDGFMQHPTNLHLFT
jgi:hypothetical protein